MTLFFQLRVRDLEGAVEMERAAKLEAIASSEKLNKQLR